MSLQGCVPTKALVKSARLVHLLQHSDEYGVRSKGYDVDFSAVMARMRRVIREAGEHDSPERFRSLGVDVFADEARFEAPDLLSAKALSRWPEEKIACSPTRPRRRRGKF